MSDSLWDHPDWYDLHDNQSVAGVEREPEHYREAIVALPPIDTADHVVDVGAGTGKLSRLLVEAYPEVGHVTLIEPNARKLARARQRLAARTGETRVTAVAGGLGEGALPDVRDASLVLVGSVLMPVLLARADGRAWVDRALREIRNVLRPGGTLLDVETVAMPWDEAAVRRLSLPELTEAIGAAGFGHVECVYRFRDRVVIRAR